MPKHLLHKSPEPDLSSDRERALKLMDNTPSREDTAPPPFEPGSDACWLWGWAERINLWLCESKSMINMHLRGVFHPDRLADQAITRNADHFPEAFKLINSDLQAADACYERVMAGRADEEELAEEMFRLRDRIQTTVRLMCGRENRPTTTGGIGKGSMTWQEAKKRAEYHVRAHDGMFPSVNTLANIVGCSRPTIDKAIEKSTYLKARRAESKARRQGRTVPLTDSAIDEASLNNSEQAELESLIAEQRADMQRDERQAKAARRRRD